ncbi:MAG: AAA family ATPase [Chloroflexota bacterium]|nr:MAG: AAA family ATPase [Chloroflexota bacterium]
MALTKFKPEVEVFISKRFQQVVSLHILKNLLTRVEAQVPLLLGIHGPSGEGKTFQCEHILKNMGVKRFLVSGGQLDNPIAGHPSAFIRQTYIRASESIRSGEASLAVVLVNDVDTGLGTWGKSEKHTINQINVFGELMHLVDYPSLVDGKETKRIPIIITGNDFTKLYNPLVRAGRMSAFEWIPTLEEKAEIIVAIFPELSQDECQRLVMELNEKLMGELPEQIKFLPVAFFSHLRANLLDEDLWDEVEEFGLDKTVDSILRGYEPDLSQKIYYERVLEKGVELARSGKLINHLQASSMMNWRV